MKDFYQLDRGKTPLEVFSSVFRLRRNPKDTKKQPKISKKPSWAKRSTKNKKKAHRDGSTHECEFLTQAHGSK